MKKDPSKKIGGHKPKHACFNCRISLKGWMSNCPTCSKPMVSVGNTFPTPAKRDIKRWSVLELQQKQWALTGYADLNSKTIKEAKCNFSRARSERFDHMLPSEKTWNWLSTHKNWGY